MRGSTPSAAGAPDAGAILVDTADIALLRQAIPGIATHGRMSGERRCHLRNLCARGLLRAGAVGGKSYLVLSMHGLRAVRTGAGQTRQAG